MRPYIQWIILILQSCSSIDRSATTAAESDNCPANSVFCTENGWWPTVIMQTGCVSLLCTMCMPRERIGPTDKWTTRDLPSKCLNRVVLEIYPSAAILRGSSLCPPQQSRCSCCIYWQRSANVRLCCKRYPTLTQQANPERTGQNVVNSRCAVKSKNTRGQPGSCTV